MFAVCDVPRSTAKVTIDDSVMTGMRYSNHTRQ